VIDDLARTLQAVLGDPSLHADFPALAKAQISFDRPTDDPTKLLHPTVNLFLYDVRENVELRSNEPHYARPGRQVMIAPPPLRVACSYVVTAWPVGGVDLALQEHGLLSQALQVLARYHTIPPQFLQGSLAAQAPPVPLVAASAEGLKEPQDFWTALGLRMRASFVVTATIALTVQPPASAPAVRTPVLKIDLIQDEPTTA
jgi:hypothetical protein